MLQTKYILHRNRTGLQTFPRPAIVDGLANFRPKSLKTFLLRRQVALQVPAVLVATCAQAALPQHPTLLSAYSVRPGWQVAGVDYAVGPVSPPTKDPEQLSLAGASVDVANRRVTINASNVTLHGYDFSLHGGYTLTINGANATVTNNLFVMGSNTSYYEISAYGDGLVLRGNTLDGTSTSTNQSALIAVYGSNPTVEFNWLKNFGQHALEMNQKQGQTTGLLYRYNLIEDGGTIAGSHVNYLQWGDGTAVNPVVTYNTTYQTAQKASGEGFQFDGFPGSLITNARFANNTMIMAGSSTALSYAVHALGDNANSDSPDNSGGTIINNYFDTSAAYGAFYPVDSLKPWVFSSNYSLRDGSAEPVSGSAETHSPARPCIAAALPHAGAVALTGKAEADSTVSVSNNKFAQLGNAHVRSSGAWSFTTAAGTSGEGPFVAVDADKTGFSVPSKPTPTMSNGSCS